MENLLKIPATRRRLQNFPFGQHRLNCLKQSSKLTVSHRLFPGLPARPQPLLCLSPTPSLRPNTISPPQHRSAQEATRPLQSVLSESRRGLPSPPSSHFPSWAQLQSPVCYRRQQPGVFQNKAQTPLEINSTCFPATSHTGSLQGVGRRRRRSWVRQGVHLLDPIQTTLYPHPMENWSEKSCSFPSGLTKFQSMGVRTPKPRGKNESSLDLQHANASHKHF